MIAMVAPHPGVSNDAGFIIIVIAIAAMSILVFWRVLDRQLREQHGRELDRCKQELLAQFQAQEDKRHEAFKLVCDDLFKGFREKFGCHTCWHRHEGRCLLTKHWCHREGFCAWHRAVPQVEEPAKPDRDSADESVA